jgi:DNA polymerase-3 subunit gamma/tau
VEAPLALYRRYRPDTFADVIGQEHVTTPLSHALANNRVHHAYLFSGPRGCGKTTSARILARALNCENGPTPTPCGECESCRELARGGPGSVDVIEIDAASHGGVDDARDLRERAFFAPMKSRFKVYIIDEAHMVTPQGFNALLKLVEEPPSHLRFVFATTEPEKVIGTIRSRTHHYPFRLVPPKLLGDYVTTLCEREGVPIEPTAVPLVVRAGAGSVRDSLSVLDQLIGGSGPDGVTYALATTLLGYTPDSLLDEIVDALAADDGATLFAVVDKVIDTGQDPRRFAEDLLHRLRDLVVVSAVPDAATRGLIQLSGDQAERLEGQAGRFGRAELTRAADIVSQGLTDMRGATAPRLLLELMCARILLPGMDDTAESLGARIDRIERRLSMPGGHDGRTGEPESAAPTRRAQTSTPPPQTASGSAPAVAQPAASPEPTSAPEPTASPEPSEPSTATAPATAAGGTDAAQDTPGAPGGGGLTLVDLRRLWPGVLERVKSVKRMTWMLLSGNAQLKDLRDGILTIGFSTGARANFLKSGHDEILRQALIDELGVDWKIEAIIDDASPGSRPAPRSEPAQPQRSHSAPTPAPADAPASTRRPDAETRPQQPPPPAPGEAVDRSTDVEAAKGAIRPIRRGGASASGRPAADQDSEVADDDDVVDDAAVTSHDLLARELGAEVIEDIRHESS